MSYIKNWVDDPQKKWSMDLNPSKYYLVLTNDMDSYLSCLILKNKFGVQIGGFYDFHGLYINPEITSGKEPIYVDCDLTEGKCYGNHYQQTNNPQAINLNDGVEKYTDKYAGSTLLMVCSLYDVDIKKYPKQIAMFLCLIDAWYTQFFNFHQQWLQWAKKLKMDWLEHILINTNRSQCNDMSVKYKAFAKIKIKNDGFLQTDFDFDKVAKELDYHITQLDQLYFPVQILWLNTKQEESSKVSVPQNRIFSAVKPYANKVIYSYK